MQFLKTLLCCLFVCKMCLFVYIKNYFTDFRFLFGWKVEGHGNKNRWLDFGGILKPFACWLMNSWSVRLGNKILYSPDSLVQDAFPFFHYSSYIFPMFNNFFYILGLAPKIVIHMRFHMLYCNWLPHGLFDINYHMCLIHCAIAMKLRGHVYTLNRSINTYLLM